jgi:hypothetical protein
MPLDQIDFNESKSIKTIINLYDVIKYQNNNEFIS